MRRLFIIISFFVALVLPVSAQWSLDSCINYAIDNNIDVMRRKVAVTQGEIDLTDAKDRVLPTLSGYAQQSFSFGRGLTANNTYANRNTDAFAVGAQFNLPIFQGLAAYRRIEYNRSSLDAVLEQVESAKDDVTLNVINAYLQALYASEMLDVARTKLEISQAELVRRQALLEAGKIPELDIYEARAQVSSDELDIVNAQNDNTLALLELAQLLNLPSADGFAIAPLADEHCPLLDPDEVFAHAWEANHAIRVGRLQLIAADKNISLAKTGYIPTLSFNAGIGTNYYRTSGFDNEAFGTQMKHNFSKSLGFSLNVPIFDAFSTRNNIRRARAQYDSADLDLADARNNLYKAITQAYTQAVGAEKKLDAAAVALENAKAAFEAMQVKFNNGRANATEFEKAKADYITAMAQAVQAKYERILKLRILAFYNK